MSQNTSIEWTDATWPCVRGCSKISDGCKFCWAIRDSHLHAGNKNPKMQAHFSGLTVLQNGVPNWTGVVRLDESILDWPKRWRKPRRIFAASSGDLFHENLPFEEIDRVFTVMALCPHHTFQVLTKRPERMRQWVISKGSPASRLMPMLHVWLGVSVENQETADSRIPELLRTPAAIRFISYEPALGPIDLKPFLLPILDIDPGLDWVIAGGESGPGARPAHPDWFRKVRDDCQDAGVPFFFKQWGGVRKGKAGATLDGKEWKEFPKGR